MPPEIFSVDGGTATGIPIDATGTAYDGAFRLPWPFSYPAPYSNAKFVFGGNPTATDAQLDVHLRDYDSGSNVATIPNVDGTQTTQFYTFNPADIDSGSDIGVRVAVDSASATAGATIDVTAQVMLYE